MFLLSILILTQVYLISTIMECKFNLRASFSVGLPNLISTIMECKYVFIKYLNINTSLFD